MIGGYRLVRKLGSGERGEVYLGHAGSGDAAEASAAAIKIFRDGTSGQSIADEIGVLARTSSPHLLGLLDVATATDGRPCAILPRLSPVSLARLLAERPNLGVGESITILAPLCTAIAELHVARACHGAIRPGSVLFDRRGAPVLACFGRASEFGDAGSATSATVAERASEPRVAADLAALAALAELVLGRVTVSNSAPSVAGVLDWLRVSDPGAEVHRFAEELAERLFGLAAATPIDFTQPIVASLGTVPARVVTSMPAGQLQTAAVATASRGPGAGRATRLLLRIVAALPAVPIAAEYLVRVRAAIASVRKPFWIAGAVGVVAIVLAVSLTQLSGGRGAASGNAATEPAAGGVSSQNRPRIPSSLASPQKGASESTVSSAKRAILADDPVAAAEALLRSRERCILKRSVLCLDGADQANSSALEDDDYLIRSLQSGGAADAAAPFSGAKAVLSERLGDSALLAIQGGDPPVAKGTALLIVKGESGWRIRDFLAN